MKSTLNLFLGIGLAACLGLCLYTSGVLSYAKDFCKTETTRPNAQTAMNNESTVFACKPGSLDKTQRERYSSLIKQLIAGKQNVSELPDGYSFGYAANEQNIENVAEFAAYERLCCPFIDFDISIKGENLSLTLKGQDGVKDFIRSEFGV